VKAALIGAPAISVERSGTNVCTPDCCFAGVTSGSPKGARSTSRVKDNHSPAAAWPRVVRWGHGGGYRMTHSATATQYSNSLRGIE